MWLIKSSIGRKFVMAITGICLVLFVTFHVLMNAVAICWPAAYNQVCEFLGANWYALIASMGLALLFIIHIIYAVWLTLQNRAARGADRYAVNARQPQVEWASKNMLVLGIVIVAFLVVHLIQFWAKMQLVELTSHDLSALPQLGDAPVGPAQGTLMIQLAFSEIWTPIVYIIGFIALWFHMTHGFWSMFHTIGWNNGTWLPRLKCIANWWTTIVVALFVIQAVVFTVLANKNYYSENEQLQEQYSEYWNEQAAELNKSFNDGVYSAVADIIPQLNDANADMATRQKLNEEAQMRQNQYINANGQAFVDQAKAISSAFEAQCPKVAPSMDIQQLQRMSSQIEQMLNMSIINETPNK